jgi:hypothetical protein
MKQTLHIFLKDARYLWIEILISFAMTFALVILYPNTGSIEFGAANAGIMSYSPAGAVHLLGWLLPPLIPISWWLLIARCVHAERLVGDRQYWVTRPYEWKTLLASKALFLIAFVYAPLLLTQCLLLIRAGFNPVPHLPALLLSALWMTNALILPVVAVAAVTSNLVRITLVALGGILYFVILAALTPLVPGTMLSGRYAFLICSFFLFCTCVAVIVTQYSSRKTRLSWTVILCLLVCIAGVSFAAPDQAMVDHDYLPISANDAPVHFAYRTNDPLYQPGAYVTRSQKYVGIALPILKSDIPDGAVILPQAIRASVEAPDGTHWQSEWLPLNLNIFYRDQSTFLAIFNMPRALYDKLKSTPLNLRLDITIQQAHKAASKQVSLPAIGDFSIPDFGVCRPQTMLSPEPGAIAAISCRAPMHRPPLTYVQTTWSYGACSESDKQGYGVQAGGWQGSLDVDSTSFSIVPIWSQFLPLSNRFPNDDPRQFHPRHLCPGVPVTFTRYNLTRRAQVALSIAEFKLPALTEGQVYVMDHPDQ